MDDSLGMPTEYPEGDRIYGVSPVLAALRTMRRTPLKLLLQDSLGGSTLNKRKDGAALDDAEKLARAAGVEVERTDKGTLNNLCGSRPHQGLLLIASPLEFTMLSSLREATPPAAGTASTGAPLWLVLDEVSDPQNFGALIRSAFFLGAQGVLVSAKNSAPLSPTVSKASAGAMELMPVYATKNLPRTLEDAREQGWLVAGAALEQSVAPEELDHTRPTVLVMGSEGHGLRTNVRRSCEALVRIPSFGVAAEQAAKEESVDSLNVSVAAGILLYSMLAQRNVLAPRVEPAVLAATVDLSAGAAAGEVAAAPE